MRNTFIILSLIMLSCSDDATINESSCGWIQAGTPEPTFNSSEDIGQQCNCSGDTWDECGECGGNGIPAYECDCNGNIVDCQGECGGDTICCEDTTCGYYLDRYYSCSTIMTWGYDCSACDACSSCSDNCEYRLNQGYSCYQIESIWGYDCSDCNACN